MGRMHKKGESGAVVNYITRNQALKKLQVTLADFRRLCILKGIFPREPRHRKKAGGGWTAAKTFYYSKDIAYLAHEPVLFKLREHKTFAKKLSKAIGKGELLRARGLEERRPRYTLDHIIKERYPTFGDACRDLDDALSMLHLFSHLPASDKLTTTVVDGCQRLCREWQYYVMRSQSLKKVFLSIKGIYYQAVIASTNEKVTWLVPHAFAQHVPNDVDFRVMLTFLEFYQTLMSFTLFRLYTELGLAYPPELDERQDGEGAGLGALVVLPKGSQPSKAPTKKIDPRNIVKEIEELVRREGIEDGAGAAAEAPIVDLDDIDNDLQNEAASEFAMRPQDGEEALPTLGEIEDENAKAREGVNLFSNCVIFLSREVSRSMLEFVCRAFGVQAHNLGWDRTLGGGSPMDEKDPSITHQIVDRPIIPNRIEGRAYLQPQWVVDSLNAGVLQSIQGYQVGETLPPHLSPFVQDDPSREGEYEPGSRSNALAIDDEEEEEEEDEAEGANGDGESAVLQLADPRDQDDPDAVERAEVAIEAAGVPFSKYQKEVEKKRKRERTRDEARDEDQGKELSKMMMGRKQRKMYDRIEMNQSKKKQENAKLEQRRHQLKKVKAKRD